MVHRVTQQLWRGVFDRWEAGKAGAELHVRDGVELGGRTHARVVEVVARRMVQQCRGGTIRGPFGIAPLPSPSHDVAPTPTRITDAIEPNPSPIEPNPSPIKPNPNPSDSASRHLG